jgi:hypothetical protein
MKASWSEPAMLTLVPWTVRPIFPIWSFLCSYSLLIHSLSIDIPYPDKLLLLLLRTTNAKSTVFVRIAA